MKMIQPNCRIQFTAEDVDFVVKTLSKKQTERESIVQLFADPETRDLLLDDECLFRALLEHCDCLTVSTHFYFYILVRHVLKSAGISDRTVADYVAEVLSEFSRSERHECRVVGRTEPLEYFFEMVGTLQKADDRTGFMLRSHIGNLALFCSGVFAERIRHRASSKGFPSLRYYEDLGRANFRVASDHRLARRYELSPIYSTLSDHFQTARRALNDLTERIFVMDEGAPGQRALFGNS